ncbi:hypothetical protein SESBI_23839 [Sesbania bispinosa]|nr:hypothetical protein SESBI_23839 [Sesbania bispinosa]
MASSSSHQKKAQIYDPSEYPRVGTIFDCKRFFTTHEQMQTYIESFVGRKILEPMCMDLDFFAAADFHFQDLLDLQGLTKFVSLECGYLIELVKVFYCNLKIVNGDLVSEVKGTHITVKPSDWLEVVGLNQEGARLNISTISNWEGYDRTTAICSMLKDPSIIPSKITVEKLTVEDQMLHYIFTKILIPKGSNYEHMTEEDIFFIWAMKQGILINWPYLISKHMLMVKLRPLVDLPYAILITKFLLHFRVDSRNEVEVIMRSRLNEFEWIAINHLKLKRIPEGWINKRDPFKAVKDGVKDDKPLDMDTMEPPFMPTVMDDRLDLLLSRLEDMRCYLGEQFHHINNNIASLDSRLKTLEDKNRNA